MAYLPRAIDWTLDEWQLEPQVWGRVRKAVGDAPRSGGRFLLAGSAGVAPGTPAKFIEFPKARYGLYQVDRVEIDGQIVGLSHDVGYITNEQAFVALASIELKHSEPGTEVTAIWGESPNSTKPAVETHRQVTVRATVQPAPYSSFARENYRKS